MYNLKSFTNLNTVSENELLVQKLRNIFKLTVCFIYPPTTLLEAKPLPRLSILATDPDVQSTAVIQLNLHGIRFPNLHGDGSQTRGLYCATK